MRCSLWIWTAVLCRMTIRRSRGCLLLYSPHHIEKKTGMHIIGSSMPLNGQNSAPIFPCRFSKVETDEATSYYFRSSLSSVILQYCKCCQNVVRQVLRKLTIKRAVHFRDRELWSHWQEPPTLMTEAYGRYWLGLINVEVIELGSVLLWCNG